VSVSGGKPGPGSGPAYFRIAERAWADDRVGDGDGDGDGARAIPAEMLDEAVRRGGGGRKLLASGEGGFHSSYSEMPPGYTMPAHRHDYDELVVVLDGGCTWSDGVVLHAHDSLVMPAGCVHGFTCGDAGMKLLTVARGPFRTELVN